MSKVADGKDQLARRRAREVADARSTLAQFTVAKARQLGRLFDMLANGYEATRTVVDKQTGEVRDRTFKVAPDPAGALAAYAKLAEYALPRLARVEQVGDGGGPVQVVVQRGQPLAVRTCVGCPHDEHEGACERASCRCVVETVGSGGV